MASKPKSGLHLHSEFAHKWSDIPRVNPVEHAAESGRKLDAALSLQVDHWASLGDHMYGHRGATED